MKDLSRKGHKHTQGSSMEKFLVIHRKSVDFKKGAILKQRINWVLIDYFVLFCLFDFFLSH